MRPAGAKVTAKARSRDDRAGDPLDGLVNLFDIGIILSVAFLLAALSSLDLTSVITEGDRPLDESSQQAPADSVLVNPDEQVETIQVDPGQEVVGRGEAVGTLYQLEDGRTVVVKPDEAAAGATGATGSAGPATGSDGTGGPEGVTGSGATVVPDAGQPAPDAGQTVP